VAITNGYTSLALLKAEVDIPQATASYDAKLEAAINAGSRQCDKFTGRRFWQDAAVQARSYFTEDVKQIDTDDISTLTGLVVKLDQDDDGTFETTLTINTNFIVLPPNAEDDIPVAPYTAIRIVDGINSFPTLYSGRPSCQITAKFGWAAVPDDVAKACLIQATQLFKASDAVFGGLNFDAGILRVRDTLNPMAAGLLEGYVVRRVG
jgi:hypothetical protein